MDVFNKKLHSYIDTLDVKKRAKYTIKDQTYWEILKVLKGEESQESAAFKYWARQNFVLADIGTEQMLYDEKTNLPIITFESIYEKIRDCHTAVGHSGRDKTWAEVKIFFFTALL